MKLQMLLAALLWLPGFLAKGNACHPPPEGNPEGSPPDVNVSSQGMPPSLLVSWTALEPGGPIHVLHLTCLSCLGSSEGEQVEVLTNASSFKFQNLVPGGRYQLDVMALYPCGHNVTVTLTTRTAPLSVQGLQLCSPGSPFHLQASWGKPPGEQDGHHLLLYHLKSHTLTHNVSMAPDALSYNFSDLLPGSEYLLEVTTWAGTLQAKTSIREWTVPVPPDHLELRALGLGALQASWNGSQGAAQLHLLLTDLLAGTNMTAVVRRGISSHTFLHLSPGTCYELMLNAVAGLHHVVGPNATEWTYPSAPLDLVLTPEPPKLQASWKAGPGAHDGFLLQLSGPVEKTIALGPDTLNASFPGPLPSGHYALELKALAGPHDAWVQASAWLDGPTAQPRQSHGATLQLHGLEATQLPGRRALLYAEGDPGLLGNISVPSGATRVTFCGLVPGARYHVTITSPLGVIIQSLTGHIAPLAPLSLEATSKGSPSNLVVGWVPAPGQREGYSVSWHQDGSQGLQGGLVHLGPDNSSLTLRGLVPGSCYILSVWASTGNLSSAVQSMRSCTPPAAPTNLTLGIATRPPALRAHWAAPPGRRDGFQLCLYRRRPLILQSQDTVAPEAQTFSWPLLFPGTEFLVQLTTLRGPDASNSINATGWMPPLAPLLVNVTSEGPSQLLAVWAHAPGGRDSYQVTLYQAGVRASTRALGAEVNCTSFWALIPGTKYEVEIVSWAGPLRAAAANVSGWTSPLLPSELLVSIQAGSAVVNLAWARGPLGRGACHAWLSEAGHRSWEQPLMLGQSRLVLRDLTPGRNLSLFVRCQAGPLQVATHPAMLPVEPGPVEDVQCQAEATHLVLNWTLPPGDVSSCLVLAEKLAARGDAQLVFQFNTSKDALLLPGLAPASSYRLSLIVLGRNGLQSRVVTLVCTTSAEDWHPPELAAAPQMEPEMGMGVVIAWDMFGKEDGRIQWFGIVTTTNMSLAQPSRAAINHTWYDHYYGGCDSYLALLLPNPFYPGPWARPKSWTVPMGTEDCGRTQDICNGPLKPGVQYRFSVVAFTRSNTPEPMISFSAFSEPRISVSPASLPLPVALGTASCCLLTVCAVLGLLCCRRRRKGQRADKRGFAQELMPHSTRRIHRPIPIHSFRQSYEAKSADAYQAFFQEFEELKEVGKEQPRVEAEHPANTTKNRYPHVLPYDHSRVRLSKLEGEPHSDYINANFIPGYTHPQEFIATQGPLKRTLEDFWRLVWEQQVHIIVMLTVGMENGRVLCEHYWPADSTPITHGQLTIHLLAEEPKDEWTRREFQLQHGAQHKQRKVKQLQFTAWPDHSVPEAPGALLTFMELVREQARATQGAGPILVHCSAGVGRTGTFVALSRLLQQLEEEPVVDVFNAVYALRLHRPLMIQTPSQYIFLHSCLLRKILEGSCDISESGPISVTNFAQVYAKKAANANAGFLREYKLLLQAIKAEPGSSAPPPGCETDGTCSYDGSTPVEDSPADNMPEAWFFPGGPSGRDHVVLMGPAGPEEIWELVWEHEACVLVSLCQTDPQEEPQGLWPSETQPVITDMVTVHWVAESSAAGWPCTLFKVTHGESGKERQVQQLQFPSWEPGQELPMSSLLPFLAAVGQCCSQRHSEKPGTLLSYSSRGTTQLGTFLAVEQLLQQAVAECTVDVFSVALQQSQACGLMTPTLEQYIELYRCLDNALVHGLP
ncbi:receptor-type tyrosine-protein phosphatase V-like [Ochotona curzoniae]|uniref:receptor-type tyrosine-protein phosphatase V-like n=1 Tax=Ochotona curzoniae TaxID=130825 RepID=UPI001B34F5EC|nr:receptor-type tyrosine-protein phosphatase V-like [Ochotona curzoniae]